MTNTGFGVPDYDDAAVARICAFVEEVTGGRIVGMERQVRWRPAWFADVEKDGAIIPLYLRGDRAGDVAIFPELRREADIIAILHQQNLPVPRIYGYLADPPCIVMESIRGTRDLSGIDPETLSSVGREYMKAVAAMHAVPLTPFVEQGVERPEGAENIALVGLRAYLPHYLRTRRKPEPMLDFVIGWIQRNVPRHRTEAGFIQFDSGQFLVENGRMTHLYDFEFSMIGDPLVDLATMGMRNSYEPLGAPLPELVGYYEEATGKPVDHDAILFHVLQFSTLGTMQFAGTVAEPRPRDPHSVYLQFDISLRRSILLALSKLSGVPLPELSPLPARVGDNAALIAKLSDTVSGIAAADPGAEAQKAQAIELIEWVSRADDFGADIVAQDIADVAALLGRPFPNWAAAEAALGDFVGDAPAERDADLITLFGRIEGRRMQVYGPTSIGEAAEHVVLPQTR
ncbi:phosphotransferase [Sphingomonas oryzagri]